MVDVKGSRSRLMSNTDSPRRQVSRSQRFGAKTTLLPGLTEIQIILTEIQIIFINFQIIFISEIMLSWPKLAAKHAVIFTFDGLKWPRLIF